MSMFGSRPPFNDDPKPYVTYADERRTDIRSKDWGMQSDGGTEYVRVHDPRPEFTRIPHNPTNPVLAEFRENVAEDARLGMPLSESIEDMLIMCNPVFWGRDEANMAHIEHARKVLKRLAHLAEV